MVLSRIAYHLNDVATPLSRDTFLSFGEIPSFNDTAHHVLGWLVALTHDTDYIRVKITNDLNGLQK
jgi:hypothetical protein